VSHDHHAPTVTLEEASVPLDHRIRRLPLPLAVVGLASLGASFALMGDDPGLFAAKYLTSFMFWLSVALGGLFFVLVHHATRAGWSTALRRIAEDFSLSLPVLGVLFGVVLVYMPDLYEWANPEVMAEDPVLAAKSGFLNPGGFTARAVLYFVLWSGFAIYLYRVSTKQDVTDDPSLTHRARWVAPLGILTFALTITAAAIDWTMSIDPHWFSTIYGVYYFAGTFVTVNAAIALAAMWMQKNKLAEDAITTEHYHDLGKYMFAFTVFWSYIAFSQYFLIWYSNIPEETFWFAYRWEACPSPACSEPGTSGWATLSMVLIFVHFVIPFFYLMSRHIKRRRATLAAGAVLLLVAHYVDMYWLIQPFLDYHHHAHHGVPMHGPHWSLLDLTTFVGIGGVTLAVFVWALARRAVVPVGDPRIGESLAFENFPTT